MEGDSEGGGQARPAVPSPADVPRRTGLNKHPFVTVAFAIVMIAVGAIAIYWETRPEPKEPIAPSRAFYTVDEGQSLFIDDAERLPPFDHGGKLAVQAFMYTCDGGKTRFVGFLRKLPEEPLRKLLASGRNPKTIDDDEIAIKFGWMAKKPGDKEWVNSKDDGAKYAQAITVACPNGTGVPQAVFADADK